MKQLFPFIKVFVIYVVLLALIGFVTGFLSTKPQLQENSIRWSASLSEGDQAQIMDTRDYGQYYFILGRYGSQRAYLSSYQKLPVIPLYTRYIIATNDVHDQTGIGFELHGKDHSLLIAPPYNEIQILDENRALVPAPASP